MASDRGPNDETSQELDQYVLETIRDQCLQLGMVNYNPTSVRWSWLNRGTTFERPPEVNHGEILLFKGFQQSLQKADWPPQILYALIRGNKRKGKNKLIAATFGPIIVALVAIPTLLRSEFLVTNGNGVVTSTTTLGAFIDLLLVLPALFSGAIIYNVILRRQRIVSDKEVVEVLGKQALLDSLGSLEAYFKTSIIPENRKKIDELATEEFQSSTHLKNKVSMLHDLLSGKSEVEKRIKALERAAQGPS